MIKILTKKPKVKLHEQVDPTKIPFGNEFTDHMLKCEWEKDKGWKRPKIVEYGNLDLSPACIALHYSCQVYLV